MNNILHLVSEENKTTVYARHKLQRSGSKASLDADKKVDTALRSRLIELNIHFSYYDW